MSTFKEIISRIPLGEDYFLDLSQEKLGFTLSHEDLTELLRLLKDENFRIISLNLSGQDIGKAELNILAPGFDHNQILESLDLSNQQQNLSANDTLALAEALGNSRVTTLNIRNNDLGDEALNPLTKLSIIDLDLARNNLSAKAIDILAKMALQRLILESNTIRDLGLEKLSAFQNLRELNVFSNNISDRGFLYFMNKASANLIKFEIGNNNLTVETAMQMRTKLRDCNIHFQLLQATKEAKEGSQEVKISSVFFKGKENQQISAPADPKKLIPGK